MLELCWPSRPHEAGRGAWEGHALLGVYYYGKLYRDAMIVQMMGSEEGRMSRGWRHDAAGGDDARYRTQSINAGAKLKPSK